MKWLFILFELVYATWILHKKLQELRNAENRISLSQRWAQQLVIHYQMFNPENIYSSNIIHTKHIVLMYLGMCIGCVYWHMYIKQLMKKCHEYWRDHAEVYGRTRSWKRRGNWSNYVIIWQNKSNSFLKVWQYIKWHVTIPLHQITISVTKLAYFYKPVNLWNFYIY